MPRSPPFNAQADCMGEEGAHGAACCHSHEIPASQHKEKHGFAVMVASLALRRDEGTEGLVSDMRGACREPELDRSGLLTWQGRTHAPASCLCEEAPWEATIDQVVAK